MDFWIPLAGGALGAAVITGIWSLVLLARQSASEHKKWLRAERFKVYAELAQAHRAYQTAMQTFDHMEKDYAGLLDRHRSHFGEFKTDDGELLPPTGDRDATAPEKYRRARLSWRMVDSARLRTDEANKERLESGRQFMAQLTVMELLSTHQTSQAVLRVTSTAHRLYATDGPTPPSTQASFNEQWREFIEACRNDLKVSD